MPRIFIACVRLSCFYQSFLQAWEASAVEQSLAPLHLAAATEESQDQRLLWSGQKLDAANHEADSSSFRGPLQRSRMLRYRRLSANHTMTAASGYTSSRGYDTSKMPKARRMMPTVSIILASTGSSTRRFVTAAPTVLEMRRRPAAVRPALPPPLAAAGSLRLSGRGNVCPSCRMISVAPARSSRYIASIWDANVSSSATTSSSQLPSQLAMLRLLDPTRAHRPSATAVLACSIDPFLSKSRSPASSSVR